jgi:hypothetical protein
MAINMKELSAALAGKGDMFLHVQAKRAGKIKGEAHQPGFTDDILVQRLALGAGAVVRARSHVRPCRAARTRH